MPDITDGVQRVHIAPLCAAVCAVNRLTGCARLHVELLPFDIAAPTERAGDTAAFDVELHFVLPTGAADGTMLLTRDIALASLCNLLGPFARVQQVIGDVAKQLIACVRHDLRALVFSKLIRQKIRKGESDAIQSMD